MTVNVTVKMTGNVTGKNETGRKTQQDSRTRGEEQLKPYL